MFDGFNSVLLFATNNSVELIYIAIHHNIVHGLFDCVLYVRHCLFFTIIGIFSYSISVIINLHSEGSEVVGRDGGGVKGLLRFSNRLRIDMLSSVLRYLLFEFNISIIKLHGGRDQGRRPRRGWSAGVSFTFHTHMNILSPVPRDLIFILINHYLTESIIKILFKRVLCFILFIVY